MVYNIFKYYKLKNIGSNLILVKILYMTEKFKKTMEFITLIMDYLEMAKKNKVECESIFLNKDHLTISENIYIFLKGANIYIMSEGFLLPSIELTKKECQLIVKYLIYSKNLNSFLELFINLLQEWRDTN